MTLFSEIILYFLLTLVMYEIFTRVRPHAGNWREMVEVNIRRYLDKSNVMSTEAMSGSTASTQEDALDNGSEVLSNGIVKDDKEKKVIKLLCTCSFIQKRRVSIKNPQIPRSIKLFHWQLSVARMSTSK